MKTKTHWLVKLLLTLPLLLAIALPNVIAAPAQAQTSNSYDVRGLVIDNRGKPIPGAAVQAIPPAFNGGTLSTNSSGQWQSQHAANTSQVFKTGSISAAVTSINQDRSVLLVVPPAANTMVNGAFESDLSGWTAAGSALVGIELAGHSGKAARLGVNCPSPCLAEKEVFFQTYDPFFKMVVDSQENTHLMVNSLNYWFRDPDGHWLTTEKPYQPVIGEVNMDLQVGKDDTLHLILGVETGIAYTQKRLNKPWTNLEYIAGYSQPRPYPHLVWIDVDPLGQVHVVYGERDSSSINFYSRRGLDGKWSTPVRFDYKFKAIAAAADGGAYIFHPDTIQRILPNGTIQNPTPLDNCNVTEAGSTNQGEIQVLCSGTPSEYRVMDAKGDWRLKHTFGTYAYMQGNFSRDGSAAFYSGELYESGKDVYWLKQPDSDELQYVIHDTRNINAYKDRSPYLTRYGGLHLASNYSYGAYSQSLVDLQTTESVLEQTVLVPDAGTNPTLSFLYQIKGLAALKESGFTLTLIDEAGTSFNLRTDRTVGLWKHGWADLSRWAGQTVTLRFRYKQAAGEPLATLLLDEVSLGTWETPVIRAVIPDTVVDWPANPVTVTLTGGYFLNGAVVELNGQSIPATVTSQGELTFDLPAGTRPGHYNIRVINPGGKQSNVVVLRLGLQHFLPFTGG